MFFKSNPTPAAVYVPSLLTNMAIRQLQLTGTVYDKMFPYCPVQDQAGYYAKFNKGDLARAITMPRENGKHSDIGFDVDLSGSYAIKTFGAKKTYGNVDASSWRLPVNRDQAATQLLMRAMKLRREKQFVAAAVTTGVWTGQADQAGGTDFVQWDDPSSTPIEQVRSAASAIQLASNGWRPNVGLFGRQVLDKLLDHPEIVERLGTGATTGTMPRLVMLETLARIFELDRVVVGDFVEETAAKGATSSPAFTVGKSVVLAYVTDSPSVETPSAGYTFTWQFLGANSEGVMVRKGVNTEDNYEFYTVDHGEDFKVVATDMGCYFSNVVA